LTSKKIFAYLSVLLIAALLLTACAPEEQAEEPAFPEAGTPFPGETAVLPDTGPQDGTPVEPLEDTPMATLAPGDETPVVTEGLETTPEAGTTPLAPGTPEAPSGGAPSSDRAEILPESGRAELTRLSALVGYQVIDRDGQVLGTANDFILNLCEAHILYIVLDADPALGLQGGEQALIPYEIVTLHSGTLNSEDRTIQLDLALDNVQAAPAMSPDAFDVTSSEWEAGVQEFWTAFGNLSLTTECRVPPAETGTGEGVESTPVTDAPVSFKKPVAQGAGSPTAIAGTPVVPSLNTPTAIAGTPIVPSLNTQDDPPAGTPTAISGTPVVPSLDNQDDPAAGQDRVALHKNAFASEVLGATVVDGNGQQLGVVEEILLEPESGRLTFAAVRLNADLQADQNLVLAPIGALNLQDDAQGTDGVTLVLLVETGVLTGAPQEASLPAPDDTGWESESQDYWGEFVPLTREELP
jgi:sporulation protein YlmC with PRC-barrel domain